MTTVDASTCGTITTAMTSNPVARPRPRRLSSPWITAALLTIPIFRPAVAAADCIDGRPINVGHRGAGNSSPTNPFPENTIPSLLAAGEQGATMVELDVQLSADGVPVLMHDATVDATTNGTGCVTELTVDELALLDAGVGTPMEGRGVTIPTLEEVLEAVDLDVNVELKYGGDGCPVPSYEVFSSAVLDVLAGDPTRRWQTMSSFELGLLQELRAQDPAAYLGFLVVIPATVTVAVDNDFDALNLSHGSVDEAVVATVHDAGLELNVWTVDDPGRIAELFALDVDAIITNVPPEVEAVRDELCPREDDTGGSSEGGSTGSSGGHVDDTGAPGDASMGDGEGTTGDGDEGSGSEATGMLAGDDEGCACRTGRSPGGWGWGTLGLVLAGLRRRHASGPLGSGRVRSWRPGRCD
jgi:glycerophosphoryl diester phosphodiesterase